MNRPLLLLAFFLSGTSGLVFQTVWVRTLTRYLGATTPALATVLGVFMGGLALGAMIGGRLADRAPRPLRLYALLEFGIAALGLLASFGIIAWVGDVYVALNSRYPDSAGLVFLGRVVFVVLCLLPSTVLMGATLPLLTAFVTRAGQGLQVGLGRLYAINTFGALVGVVVTGFYLLGEFGESTCLYLAASLNVVAGLLAFALRGPSESNGRPLAAPPSDAPDYPTNERRWAFVAFFVSGFTALAYEVLWSRLLVLVLETSIYAFSSMLGLFLLGIAYGSHAATREGGTKSPLAKFGLLEIAIGCWTAVGLLVFPWLDPRDAGSTVEKFGYNALHRLSVAAVLILPVAYMFGRQFPIAVRCCAGRGDGSGRLTGRAYAVNTLGTILGSLLTGFVLIPKLGVAVSMLSLGALNVVLGGILLALAPAHERRGATLFAGVLAVVFVAATILAGDPYGRVIAQRIKANCHDENATVFDIRDGIAGTCVAGGVRGDREKLALLVDGQGMTKLVTETKVITHLPYLLAKEPKRYLIICFGMGTTARSASRYTGLEIDAVDLVPEVFDYFHHYHADADAVKASPNVRLHVNDGRNHLLVESRPYDMITVDPAPPLHSAGTVNLYTREFFNLAKSKLTDGGVFCMWVPPARESEILPILRTFADVFPDGCMWGGLRYEGFYLTGGRHPIRPSVEERAAIVKKLSAVADLGEWDQQYTDVKNLDKLYITDCATLAKRLDGVPTISDDKPYTEFPLWRFVNEKAKPRVFSAKDFRDADSAFNRDYP